MRTSHRIFQFEATTFPHLKRPELTLQCLRFSGSIPLFRCWIPLVSAAVTCHTPGAMKTLTPLLSLCLATCFALQSFAVEIEGVQVSETKTTGAGDALVLNGAGVRKKLMFKLYVGALYLSEKGSDASAILAAKAPMMIDLHIISSKINSDNMTKATMEGFENSTGGKIEGIQAEIDQFLKAFSAPIEKGDSFTICYKPGMGVNIAKNGQKVDSIADAPGFKEALFGIWLSDKPAQESLKSAMLGIKE